MLVQPLASSSSQAKLYYKRGGGGAKNTGNQISGSIFKFQITGQQFRENQNLIK